MTKISNTHHLVSVVMPTYNVVDYVAEAVNSILEQTYENLELIIVDDASVDGTYETLLQLASTDQRIRLFRNPKNLKIVEALNYGLSQAKGSFIARMDGDDISLPNRIEEQMAFLLQNPEIDLVGLNVIVVNENGLEVKRIKFASSAETSKQLLPFYSPVPHFWVARANTYNLLGKYRIATAEDYDFLLRMGSANLKFCNLQQFLYKQRIRQGNTATASGLTQRKLAEYALDLYKERIHSKQLTDSYDDKILEMRKNVGGIEKFFFNLSNSFMYKFSLYVQANKIKAFYYLFFTILLSPKHQFKYFYNKYKYNSILKNESSLIK